jgi:hypothetical protein
MERLYPSDRGGGTDLGCDQPGRIGYQPAQAGSVVATVEIGLSLVVAILACVILRW